MRYPSCKLWFVINASRFEKISNFNWIRLFNQAQRHPLFCSVFPSNFKMPTYCCLTTFALSSLGRVVSISFVNCSIVISNIINAIKKVGSGDHLYLPDTNSYQPECSQRTLLSLYLEIPLHICDCLIMDCHHKFQLAYHAHQQIGE